MIRARRLAWPPILLLGSLLGCGRHDGIPPPSTGLDLQSQSYAKARAQFRTDLLEKGPSPQKWRPVTAPRDVQEVNYTSGKLKLKAWFKPATAKSARPAVLFLHGGFAFGHDDWGMAQPFRDAGFAVMTPMLRGENGQSGYYSLFYDEVDDVLAAADYLAKVPGVDPKRIFIAGHSAGGTLTLLAALASKQFRAAASFSGSPDLVVFARGMDNSLIPFDPSRIREYQMRSPVAFANSFQCPVRIYYGSLESIFDAGSRRTAALAQQHKLDVQAIRVTGDHFSSVPTAIERAIEFFKQQ
jgi:dienelactone hydrolase